MNSSCFRNSLAWSHLLLCQCLCFFTNCTMCNVDIGACASGKLWDCNRMIELSMFWTQIYFPSCVGSCVRTFSAVSPSHTHCCWCGADWSIKEIEMHVPASYFSLRLCPVRKCVRNDFITLPVIMKTGKTSHAFDWFLNTLKAVLF